MPFYVNGMILKGRLQKPVINHYEKINNIIEMNFKTEREGTGS